MKSAIGRPARILRYEAARTPIAVCGSSSFRLQSDRETHSAMSRAKSICTCVKIRAAQFSETIEKLTCDRYQDPSAQRASHLSALPSVAMVCICQRIQPSDNSMRRPIADHCNTEQPALKKFDEHHDIIDAIQGRMKVSFVILIAAMKRCQNVILTVSRSVRS